MYRFPAASSARPVDDIIQLRVDCGTAVAREASPAVSRNCSDDTGRRDHADTVTLAFLDVQIAVGIDCYAGRIPEASARCLSSITERSRVTVPSRSCDDSTRGNLTDSVI